MSGPSHGEGARPVKELRQGEVHVWSAKLEEARANPELLSAAEIERAGRIGVPRARRVFLASRTLLRRVLAEYAGIPAAQLQIVVEDSGKPRLEAPSWLRFNIAHSASVWVCAVARDRDVGIDVEDFDRRVEVEAIARRLFAPEEIVAIAALEGEARRRAFFRVWAQREAVVKARGTGMLDSGRMFSVEGDPGRPPRAIGAGQPELALAKVPLESGTICILARAGVSPPIELTRFEA